MRNKTRYDNKKNIFNTNVYIGGRRGGLMVRSTPDRAVRVRDLAGDIALCSWARQLTLTVPLSTQVYKWVPLSKTQSTLNKLHVCPQ